MDKNEVTSQALETLRRRRPSHVEKADEEPTRGDVRSDFERDLDRIFYTPYFRRLAEVTQVSAGSETGAMSQDRPIPHTRMTHSLKVGQLSRRLVQHLRQDGQSQQGLASCSGLDPNVAEAAGRAHDMGHAPFGHLGEQELDEIARSHGLTDGFEGNAQTFRIISSLAYHKSRPGLDLTAAVQAACVKYPRPRGVEGRDWRKFGYYSIDEPTFNEFVRPLLAQDGKQTLESEVMDWADDITYAVHDVEDFFFGGLIPLERLAHITVEIEDSHEHRPLHPDEVDDFWSFATRKLRNEGKDVSAEARRRFEFYATRFPRRPYDNTVLGTAAVGALSSRIITNALEATHIRSDGVLDVEPTIRETIDIFKQLAWYFVIDHPELAARQQGQRARLRSLANKLIGWSLELYSEDETPPWPNAEPQSLAIDDIAARTRMLPVQLRERIDPLIAASGTGTAYESREHNIVRGVIDYVASLREREVTRLTDALGLASGSSS